MEPKPESVVQQYAEPQGSLKGDLMGGEAKQFLDEKLDKKKDLGIIELEHAIGYSGEIGRDRQGRLVPPERQGLRLHLRRLRRHLVPRRPAQAELPQGARRRDHLSLGSGVWGLIPHLDKEIEVPIDREGYYQGWHRLPKGGSDWP